MIYSSIPPLFATFPGCITGAVGAFMDISANKVIQREREQLLLTAQAQAEEMEVQAEELQTQNDELGAAYTAIDRVARRTGPPGGSRTDARRCDHR